MQPDSLTGHPGDPGAIDPGTIPSTPVADAGALVDPGFWSQINGVDIGLALAFVLTLLLGLSLGFYRQIALAAALTLGLGLAGLFTDSLASTSFMASARDGFGPGGARMLSYGILLGLPLGGAILSFFFFPRMFNKALRFLDTLMGGAIGMGCTVLLFWLLLFGSVQFESNPLAEPVRESYLGSRLARGACYVSHVFPENLRLRMEARFRETLVPLIRGQEDPLGTTPPARL